MPATRIKIFISSVQKELAAERRALKDYMQGDPLLRRFFDVFLFENMPASDRRTDDVYYDEVNRCNIYVGLFGKEYGKEDIDGLSPTEREFDRATAKGKVRLIFVKGVDDADRHPKMVSLIRKAGEQLIRRRFIGIPDLTADLYASLVEHMVRDGTLRTRPFDAAACPKATLEDISIDKVKWFVGRARRERQFTLDENMPVSDVLTHLNLFDGSKLSHAALLLFGLNPQRFLLSSEVKCMHFHGIEVRKPIPSYQIYKGTVFDLVNQAVDFVMSKIARTVGTRSQGPEAPVEYELPRDVVAEAIVNAVVHRDYVSNASVQVMLFSDRLEVWNPGELPPPLTVERLRKPHASIPRNPLICEPMFLVRYAEKAGSGILDMIALCEQAGLPGPDFRQDGGQFVQTVWRDWLTEELLVSHGLNDRQMKAMAAIRQKSRLSTMDYQALTGAARSTAKRDLEDLAGRGVLLPRGSGRGAFYELSKKWPINGPNGPSITLGRNSPQMAHESEVVGKSVKKKTKSRSNPHGK